jgi:hypothetical protein
VTGSAPHTPSHLSSFHSGPSFFYLLSTQTRVRKGKRAKERKKCGAAGVFLSVGSRVRRALWQQRRVRRPAAPAAAATAPQPHRCRAHSALQALACCPSPPPARAANASPRCGQSLLSTWRGGTSRRPLAGSRQRSGRTASLTLATRRRATCVNSTPTPCRTT